MLCSTRSAILVNGCPTQEFNAYRGVPQGDPLSPFLFIIVMEALTNCLHNACNAGLFCGIKLPNDGPNITHLLYADDAMIIGSWSTDYIKNIARILRCFHLASGLRINFHKSCFHGINLNSIETVSSTEILLCKAGNFPVKYLGLVVGSNMNRINNWDDVIHTFETRLSNWKATNLSIGGRLTLLRSVLDSLPTYYFSLYKAPVSVLNKLESLRKSFFWGGTVSKSKIHWISWERVIEPHTSGGLGLGDLNTKNLSLLAKWWWRFHNEKNGLWARVIRAIHHSRRNCSFILCNSNSMGVWKTIASLNSHLESYNVCLDKLFTGTLGNGYNMRFWIDSWIGNTSLREKYPNLFALEKEKDCRIINRCTGRGRFTQWEWNWKYPHSPTYFVYTCSSLHIRILNPRKWMEKMILIICTVLLEEIGGNVSYLVVMVVFIELQFRSVYNLMGDLGWVLFISYM